MIVALRKRGFGGLKGSYSQNSTAPNFIHVACPLVELAVPVGWRSPSNG